MIPRVAGTFPTGPATPPRLPPTRSAPLRGATARRLTALQPPLDFGLVSISSDHLDVTLPIPPSINHQYATVNGRRLLSATGRAYKAHVAQTILLALARAPQRSLLLKTVQSEFLGLSIRFHFASPLRRDVDSGLKITQDALCEALGINDNRILHIHLSKTLDATSPRTEVSLFRSTPQQSMDRVPGKG